MWAHEKWNNLPWISLACSACNNLMQTFYRHPSLDGLWEYLRCLWVALECRLFASLSSNPQTSSTIDPPSYLSSCCKVSWSFPLWELRKRNHYFHTDELVDIPIQYHPVLNFRCSTLSLDTNLPPSMRRHISTFIWFLGLILSSKKCIICCFAFTCMIAKQAIYFTIIAHNVIIKGVTFEQVTVISVKVRNLTNLG